MGAAEDCTRHRKEARKYKRALVALTSAVAQCVDALDAAMELPESRGRGRKIAQISNALEMANDSARYFALDVDFRTDRKAKRAQVQ
jgi:hypothetical protein